MQPRLCFSMPNGRCMASPIRHFPMCDLALVEVSIYVIHYCEFRQYIQISVPRILITAGRMGRPWF